VGPRCGLPAPRIACSRKPPLSFKSCPC
jgi:hypothetical protein